MFVSLAVMGAQGNILVNGKVAATGTPNGVAIDAPVWIVGTTTPVKANEYVAELWWSPNSMDESSFTPAVAQGTGKLIQSKIAGAKGYIVGGANEVIGSTAGQDAFFQIRVYSPGPATVPTDLSAWNAPTTTMWGKSAVLKLTLTTAPATPMPLVGLSTIYVEPVPEPTILALGVLGLGAFLIRRRS